MSFQPQDFAYFIGFSSYYFKLVRFCSLLLPLDMTEMLPAYKVGHLGRFQGKEKIKKAKKLPYGCRPA